MIFIDFQLVLWSRGEPVITPIAWALMRTKKINDYSEVEHDFEIEIVSFMMHQQKKVTLGEDRSIDTQIHK